MYCDPLPPLFSNIQTQHKSIFGLNNMVNHLFAINNTVKATRHFVVTLLPFVFVCKVIKFKANISCPPPTTQ